MKVFCVLSSQKRQKRVNSLEIFNYISFCYLRFNERDLLVFFCGELISISREKKSIGSVSWYIISFVGRASAVKFSNFNLLRLLERKVSHNQVEKQSLEEIEKYMGDAGS